MNFETTDPIFFGVRVRRNAQLTPTLAENLRGGVYTTWDDCKAALWGKGLLLEYQRFSFRADAAAFSSESVKFLDELQQQQKHNTEVMIHGFKRPAPVGNERPKSDVIRPRVITVTPQEFHQMTTPAPSIAKASTSSAASKKVYTDGSCTDNGKSWARAGYGVYWGPGDPRNVAERLPGNLQTNQRAEIFAAIAALSEPSEKGPLEILTDSQFTIDSAKWVFGRVKHNNWTTKEGGPVKNRDLLVELHSLIKSRDVLWTKVKAHSGISGNEEADRLANSGRLKN